MKKFYRKHFLGCELLLSISLIIISIYITYNYIGIPLLEDSLKGIRNNFYGTMGSLAGALLGFVITGLSVLLIANSTENIKKLKRSKHYKTIFNIFFSTSKYLGVLLIVSLISLVFDKDTNPSIILFFVTIWAFLIVVLRLFRCIWVLEKIVNLHIKNS